MESSGWPVAVATGFGETESGMTTGYRRGPGIRRWVAVLAAALLAACGGDGTPATSTPGAATTTSEAPDTIAPPAGGDGWASLLAAVPDTEANRSQVILNDYRAAQVAAGIPPLAADAPAADIVTYAVTLSLGVPGGEDDGEVVRDPPLAALPMATFGQRAVASWDEWEAEYGFTLAQVERDLIAGQPPDEVIVFEGSFSPASIAEVLRADPGWAGDLEVVEHEGGSYYRWGEDFAIDPRRASPARPLGRGGRLAVGEDRILRTYGSEAIESALGAIAGDVPSLADVPEMTALAGALDRAGAYAALLTMAVADLAAAGVPEGSGPFLEPYRGLAIGPGVGDDGQAFVVIALVHGDEAAAAANAGRIPEIVATGSSLLTGRPWSDVLEVQEVRRDGTVTVAVLSTDRPRLWSEVVFARDGLVLWS